MNSPIPFDFNEFWNTYAPAQIKEWNRLIAPVMGRFSQTHGALILLPRILCADGLSLSAQANWGAYCTPRSTAKAGEACYVEVEVGFPIMHNQPYPLISLAEYAEGDDCTGVFGWVPVELLHEIIERHGGAVGIEWVPSEDGYVPGEEVTYDRKT